VTIITQGAIDAGAQWRRVGTSTWRNSGYTESSIPVGQYSVEFKDIAGWTEPPDQPVTINDGQTTYADATYTQQTGSLQVTLSPQGAIDAGGKWRRVGTSTWYNSGYTESSIPIGQYTVEFSTVSCWDTPDRQIVTINEGETSGLNGSFSLLIPLAPDTIYCSQDTVESGAEFTLSWSAAADAESYQLFEDDNLIYEGSGLDTTLSRDDVREYLYELACCNACGCSDTTAVRTVYVDIANSVEEINSEILPEDFALRQNYPNPFNPETRIEFSLPRSAHVEIYVFNIEGKRICTLVNQYLSAGEKAVTWHGTDDTGQPVSTGVYFYRIEAGAYTDTKKMLLIK
jgi:hypothetical protein